MKEAPKCTCLMLAGKVSSFVSKFGLPHSFKFDQQRLFFFLLSFILYPGMSKRIMTLLCKHKSLRTSFLGLKTSPILQKESFNFLLINAAHYCLNELFKRAASYLVNSHVCAGRLTNTIGFAMKRPYFEAQ